MHCSRIEIGHRADNAYPHMLGDMMSNGVKPQRDASTQAGRIAQGGRAVHRGALGMVQEGHEGMKGGEEEIPAQAWRRGVLVGGTKRAGRNSRAVAGVLWSGILTGASLVVVDGNAWGTLPSVVRSADVPFVRHAANCVPATFVFAYSLATTTHLALHTWHPQQAMDVNLHPPDDYSHRFFIWHEWIQVCTVAQTRTPCRYSHHLS